MSLELSIPPMEPYKAATTIVPGKYPIPSLPLGVRRLETTNTAVPPMQSSTTGHSGLLHSCQGVVIRENSTNPLTKVPAPLTPASSKTPFPLHKSKPTATVIPTAGFSVLPVVPTTVSVCSTRMQQSTHSKSKNVGTQTDDAEIDMDLLFHIEDMLRTQRSLTLPRPLQSVSKSFSARCRPSSTNECAADLDDLESPLQKQIIDLKEALCIQTKVNADLKRLLVSALAGNTTLAEKLAELTSNNANLYGRSENLAAQKEALAEVADTAGIAADVWRAKCLAGRVIATEAARRVAIANRESHLARHALAHLLGERARLRLELGQAAAALHATTFPSSRANNPAANAFVVPPVARDTIGLAALCNSLTMKRCSDLITPDPVLCQSDTPGEQLALRVLTNNVPDHVFETHMVKERQSSDESHCFASDSELSAPVPPEEPPSSNDFILQALIAFSSTHSFSTADPPCASNCRKCSGNLSTV
ncbi:unnamed protein product [Calicophoron daubneyi]|uniref:Uncharacterized protein n=1 Tax=Calicophoron daubneyi TaxID=300641 RepID=A0AAV2TZL1_CALDB